MFEITLDSFIRTITVGVLAYVGLVAFLRIAGKRVLTKLNAFDLVVSVALGSTLATILLDANISLPEGLLAFAILIGLQYIISITAMKSSSFNKLIKSEPKLLFLEGKFLEKAMKEERIKKIEILQVIRSSGLGSIENAKAVVLETDGSMSVISSEPKDSLENVKNVD
ncbi:MAG TPA: YetF domain-containing protein [Planococcus sp. (in: firmicutes)]|nr:YetF domain-containing protein [Planococcus sp. (in: firmicutes)]